MTYEEKLEAAKKFLGSKYCLKNPVERRKKDQYLTNWLKRLRNAG